MAFQDDTTKLTAGRISNAERAIILDRLGRDAQILYDQFIMHNEQGYDLRKLKGSLQFEPNIQAFKNRYYLKGKDSKWTKIAYYFEYGTGLFNSKRAGQYHGGYIKPVTREYMHFLCKDGRWRKTKRVAGVHPVFAMTKAEKIIEFNRADLQRQIRMELQNE